MSVRSPEQVSGPPVGSTVVGIHVEEHLSAFFPNQQSHWEQKTRDTQQEEVELSTTEDSVDARNVEQDDQEDCFAGNTTEHVFVDSWVDQWALK